MAFDVKRTLVAMQNHIAKGGFVRSVRIGEPKAPSESYISAAVFMSGMSVVGTTLSDTIEVHTVTVRLYSKLKFVDTTDNEEFELASLSAEIASSFMGDFDLDGTIRNVDVAGQYGQVLTEVWGHIDVSTVMFRIVDITVPMIVDGSTTLAA